MRTTSRLHHSLMGLFGFMVAGSAAFAAGPWETRENGDLGARLTGAPNLSVHDLQSPLKTTSMSDRTLYAPNPDGKTYDVIRIAYQRYGGPNAFIIMDMGTAETKIIETGRTYILNIPQSEVGSDGKLYISYGGTSNYQRIAIYAPATNDLNLEGVALPNTIKAGTNAMCQGTDGKVYVAGGTDDRAVAAASYDPKTGKVEYFGPLGPVHPTEAWGYSVAADDTHVYIASGKVPWYLVAHHRKTGETTVLLETTPHDSSIHVRQRRWGVTASATGLLNTDGKRQEFFIHQGKVVPMTAKDQAPPWAEPSQDPQTWRRLPPRPEMEDTFAVPGSDGLGEIKLRQPGEEQWRTFRYTIPVYAQPIYRLTELPDGRILGTAGSYKGNFIHDPTTNEATHQGVISLSHYATAILDGIVYMSGYSGSKLYRYDPSKPWTANAFIPGTEDRLKDDHATANPRYLGMMRDSGAHKMYAGAVGADGKVYFGGQFMRDGKAGGLGWVDVANGEIGGMWKPFSNHQICFMTATDGGNLLAISTFRVDDALLNKPKPNQGAILIFDVKKKEVVRVIEPVMDVRGPGPVVSVGKTGLIGLTNNPDNSGSVLWTADAVSGKVLFTRPINVKIPAEVGSNQQEPFDFRMGPDGMVWTFLDNVLVRIDPSDGSIHPVGKVSRGGRIAFSGQDVYLGGSEQLRAIRGVVGQSAPQGR